MMSQHSLPKGWRRDECLRDGIGANLVQVVYWSPQVSLYFNISKTFFEWILNTNFKIFQN